MSVRGAAAAEPRRHPSPARPRPRPTAVARRRRRRLRLRLGLATIPLVALLFAGVVFINSAELRMTKRQGQIARQMAQVQEQIAQLNSLQAQRDVAVQRQAEKLGMVRPKTDDLTFVPIRPAAP